MPPSRHGVSAFCVAAPGVAGHHLLVSHSETARFGPDQIVTVFRSRLDPARAEEYSALAARMSELAAGMPGFVDAKTFCSDDGERVTVVTFADIDSHRAWGDHPEHRRAQELGRTRLYLTYTIQVCVAMSAGEQPGRA